MREKKDEKERKMYFVTGKDIPLVTRKIRIDAKRLASIVIQLSFLATQFRAGLFYWGDWLPLEAWFSSVIFPPPPPPSLWHRHRSWVSKKSIEAMCLVCRCRWNTRFTSRSVPIFSADDGGWRERERERVHSLGMLRSMLEEIILFFFFWKNSHKFSLAYITLNFQHVDIWNL